MSITKKDCVAALQQSGLSAVDAEQTVTAMMERKKRLAADVDRIKGEIAIAESMGGQGRAPDTTGMSPDEAALARKIKEDHDAARVEAAIRRRQTAINIMRRADLQNFIDTSKASGFSALDAMEAVLVGNPKRMYGARRSIDSRRQGLEGKWQGQFLNEMESIGQQHGGDKHTMLALMRDDPDFFKAFVNERIHGGDSNDPRISAMVDLYDRLSTDMRLRLNDAGANIRELKGRLPQSHDPMKLLDKNLGGKGAWLDFVEKRVDIERTFGAALPPEKMRTALSGVYDTLSTGRDPFIDATAMDIDAGGGYNIGPQNIAKGLGATREIHFSTPDFFLEYNKRYGKGNLLDAMLGEVGQNARRLSLMETLGTNPESMVRSLLEAEKNTTRMGVEAGAINTDAGAKTIKRLNEAFTPGISPAGNLARWLSVLKGETLSPVNVGLAKAGGIARSWMALSKLGAATLSAMADPFTKAASLRVNGVGFLERYQSTNFLETLRGTMKYFHCAPYVLCTFYLTAKGISRY